MKLPSQPVVYVDSSLLLHIKFNESVKVSQVYPNKINPTYNTKHTFKLMTNDSESLKSRFEFPLKLNLFMYPISAGRKSSWCETLIYVFHPELIGVVCILKLHQNLVYLFGYMNDIGISVNEWLPDLLPLIETRIKVLNQIQILLKNEKPSKFDNKLKEFLFTTRPSELENIINKMLEKVDLATKEYIKIKFKNDYDAEVSNSKNTILSTEELVEYHTPTIKDYERYGFEAEVSNSKNTILSIKELVECQTPTEEEDIYNKIIQRCINMSEFNFLSDIFKGSFNCFESEISMLDDFMTTYSLKNMLKSTPLINTWANLELSEYIFLE